MSGGPSLRIVAGTLGGRRFAAPPGRTTRPTADRVRQAVFNALDSLDAVEGARVLDAFAGSGGLGLEALSRGAEHATFAEADRVARETVEANVAALGVGDRARVVGSDGTVMAGTGPWDLVLVDPPYAFEGWEALLDAVAAGLSPEGMAVLESDRGPALPATLRAVRSRKYGGTVVVFVARAGDPT